MSELSRWARVVVFVISCLLPLTSHLSIHAQRYVGGDISLLPQYEKYNVPYYDADGQKITDMLQYMKSEAVGWNAQRVRLFVNPTPSLDYNDPAICQDIDYVVSLKPASVKGVYVKSIAISATMSPGLRVTAQ